MPLLMLAILCGRPVPGLVAIVMAVVLARHRGQRYLLLVFAAIGVAAWTQYQLDQALAARWPLAADGSEQLLSGRVIGLPEHQRLAMGERALWRTRFVFETQSPQQPDRLLRLQLDLYQPGAEIQLAAADQLTLLARVDSPRGLINAYGHDSERQALGRGLHGKGVVREVRTRSAGPGLHAWRATLAAKLRARAELSPLARSLLPALVVADRQGLGDQHWHTLQHTGTAHLVAISGLHISLVAGLVWWLVRGLLMLLWSRSAGVRQPARWAIWPALLAALGYAALAGFSLPTQRALLMLVTVMLLLASGLAISPQRLLAVVFTVLVLPQPLVLLDNSFWLSFGAVALLVLLRSCAVRGLLANQWLLTLVFGVLAAELFSLWSLAALPANLLLVPLYSLVVVPMALLASALIAGDLPVAGLLALLDRLLVLSWQWLEWLSWLPSLPLPGSFAALLLLVLVLLRWHLPAWPGPRWLWLFCLLPWWLPASDAPAVGDVRVTVFDVGQGQLIALRTREHLLLYDLGPNWGQRAAADSLLLPWLQRQRLTPELAIISHGDQDHAGGADWLLRQFPQITLLSGEPQRVSGSQSCQRGQHWQFDQVTLRVLWPPAELPLHRSNNRSCVVLIEADNQRLLLTGDIGREVEYWLVAEDNLRVDLLQVPHHGSGSSSSFALLRATAPARAFASAGWRNRFGHPAEHIAQRYRDHGTAWYVTAEQGMLQFAGASETVRSWRQYSDFPWRQPAAKWVASPADVVE